MSDEFKRNGDRAMQVMQLIMLSALLGGGGYIGNAVLEGQRAIARIGSQMEANASEHRLVYDELKTHRDSIAGLDRRVTVIETRGKGDGR